MPTAPESAFQFLDYRMPRFHFAKVETEPDQDSFELSIQFSSETKEVEEARIGDQLRAGFDTDEFDQFNLVELAFQVEWEPTPGPFELDSIIEGLFARSSEMTEAQFRDFSEIVAPSVLFSHARPIVNLLMMEAKETFRLPLLNIAQVIRKERERE